MSEGNGKLPAGWQTAKLGDLIVEAATGFACGRRANDGAIQLRMNNVSRRGELDWSSFIRVPAEKEMIDDYGLHAGDVVFNNTNSAEMVGKTAFFDGFDEPVVFSNHFTRLRTRPDALAPDFLALWLHCQWQAGLFARICDRWIGQSAVQRNKLLALEILLPPLEEQRRIAARLREQLSILAEARAAFETQLTTAEFLPAAHLRTVFQSEEARLWPLKRVGDCAEIVGGIQKTPSRAPVRFHKAFLTVRNVQRGFLDLSKIERFEVTQSEFERYRLLRGDLLIVEGNGSIDHIGRNALFNEEDEWIHQNHIIRVRLSRDAMVPEFVSAYLNSDIGRVQLIEKARTTIGLYTLSAGKIATLLIPSPPVVEQNVIAAQLSASFTASVQVQCTLRAKLAELVKLPAALLRAAFQPDR